MKIKGEKERIKTSPFWLLPDEEFILLIKKSKRWKDVFDFFGLINKGGNSLTLKKRILFLKLDTSHFLGRIDSSNFTREVTKEEFKSDWLTIASNRARNCIKKYLLKFDLLNYSCKKCGLDEFWQGERLALQLEHINGISNDNRIENLCFLCPNCHSQTSTFAGKSNKKPSKLCSCGNEIHKSSERCLKCSPSKIVWPEPKEMQKQLWEIPTSKIAKELGVSDKAIEKFCKKHNLTKPPRGFWQKAGAVGFEPTLELNP